MPAEVIADTTDLFVLREENFGQLEDEVFGPSFFIMLRNFPLNEHVLRPTHVETLRGRVTFELKKPVIFGEFYAMTDRSGARQVNYTVAGRRLKAVQSALLPFGAPFAKFHHPLCKAIGEDFWEAKHERDPNNPLFNDNLKAGDFRMVAIALSPAPIGVPTRNFSNRAVANTLAFCRRHAQKRG